MYVHIHVCICNIGIGTALCLEECHVVGEAVSRGTLYDCM